MSILDLGNICYKVLTPVDTVLNTATPERCKIDPSKMKAFVYFKADFTNYTC